MFGIGFPELILILALALIVVGPDKLPDLARSIAKTLVDLRKTAEGLKKSIEAEDNPITEIKPQLEEAAKSFRETILDKETNTWKPPADLADLASTIKDQDEDASPTDPAAGSPPDARAVDSQENEQSSSGNGNDSTSPDNQSPEKSAGDDK